MPMTSARVPTISGPLTATTLVIRQKTPMGVILMIIIMIFMTISFISSTNAPTFLPRSPAARMPAPKKMAMTMTGSMSASTMGPKRLSGKMPTMTSMTLGASAAS